MLTFFHKRSRGKGLVRFGLLLGCLSVRVMASPATVFFYNPEASVDNFAALKTEFDTYLGHQGDYDFQPFNDRATFEETLAQATPGVYLLSSWHYTQLSEKLSLNPVLVGMARGEVSQRKTLVARLASTDIRALSEATVAGSGTEEYLHALLNKMLGNEKRVSGFRLLTVPRDMDALMAVGFGVAGAAIASEASLDKLAQINARQRDQLQTIATSDRILLLIAAVPGKTRGGETALVHIVEAMRQQPGGVRVLQMLGLDDWKRVEHLEASLAKTLNREPANKP